MNRAETMRAATKHSEPGKWFFLCAFIFACFLFWWVPSVLFRIVVHRADAVDDATVVLSIVALSLFVAGYLLPVSRRPPRQAPAAILDACGGFAYNATLLLFVPAAMAAIQQWYAHAGIEYGLAGGIPRPIQAILYTHLFFGFMFLGTADPEKQGRREIVIAVAAVILPRFIVSLHGARFFLAQAVMPALLIAITRGWIRLGFKRIVQVALLALAILFGPAITRGDSVIGREEILSFFAIGSSLQLFQDNTDLNLNGYCPPLIVSLTAKTIPYGAMGVCVFDFAGLKNMPATLSRILTMNDPTSYEGTVSGTGSNYLLDLYLFGGMPAVYLGSALFGFSCRRFMLWIGKPSLLAGIWAECLTRALFAPRSDLGYVYERILPLFLATLLVVAVVWCGRLLRCTPSTAGTLDAPAPGTG
jgi:hypothetical protein